MAEGIVTFVLEKLSDAVVKEVLQIQGVGKQVETLSLELRRIKSFLKDADMMQTLNERQKNWVNEIRDVAYYIEDVIDNAHFLKAPENPSKEFPRGGSRIVGAGKRMWGKRKRLPALHNLGSEMNEILARIQDIIQSREKYEITFSGEGSGERLKLPVRPIIVPDIDDPSVVGFDPHRDNIVQHLLDTSTKRRAIISIVGPGGLGKTTLAQKVYNSNDVKRQFDVHIWVTISQEFNLMDILRKIIEQVQPLLPNDLERGEQHLLRKLHETLDGKKYLLVLDDIWKSDLWIQIGRGVLPDEIGTGVIMTTRIQNIVGDAEPYELPYLTEEASLELLLKKALPNREYPDDLYELGKQFVKKSGRLPLALVALGGLLSKRPDNYAAWSKMLQTMNWKTDGRECTEIIATSYNDLPFVLKSCFMYLAVFPEDYEINAERLFQLWVAERLIPAEETRTLEDTAEIFLEDLVQRSLVQVSRRSHVGSITSCRIHDLLREVAIQKAKEDNFVTICLKPPDNWMSVAKARRVAVHYSGCDELMKHANPNLRSLLCFEKPLPNCSRQRLLKVLGDMHEYSPNNPINFEYFHGLTQLRYCKLAGSGLINTTSFESFISGLKFVETFDFRNLDNVGELPEDIWNVKTLRHVQLTRGFSGPSSSADLRTLQTLRGVHVWNQDSWNAQLPKLPNLRSLGIEVESLFSWDLFAKLLDTLKHLTSLHLCGTGVPLEIVNIQRFPFYQHLQYLHLMDHFPNKLSLQVGMFPIHITELVLNGVQFNVDPLPMLEKLCNLRRLCLCRQANQKMSCSDGGFKQLHEFMFVDQLGNLEELEIKSGAMPILKKVTLRWCDKLGVPLGLQYLSNLKELKVEDCSKLNEHADEIRDICKHVPYIYIGPFI